MSQFRRAPAAVRLPAPPEPPRSGRRFRLQSRVRVGRARCRRRARAQRSGADQELRRPHRPRGRRPRAAGRPGARAGRRERRRQVHADEDPRRRPPGRRGHRRARGATLCRSATRSRPSRAGVSTVFQEFNLLPERTIAENVHLGREPRRFGLVDLDRMNRETAGAARRPRRHRPPGHPAGALALGRRAAGGRDRQGAQLRRADPVDGRADRRARRPRGRAPLLDHRAADRPRRRDPLRLAPDQGDLRPLRRHHRAQGRPPGRPPARPPSSTTPSWSG